MTDRLGLLRQRAAWTLRPASFGRDVLLLVTAGGLGQVIGIAAAPLLTRLYSPVDFGALSVYTSILSLVGVAVCLRYELAIPMPASDADGRGLLVVALAVAACVAAVTTVLVILFGGVIARVTNTPALIPWLALVSVSVGALGAFEAVTQWCVRSRQFSLMARAKVGQTVAQVGAQLALGVAGFGPAGLIFADAGSRAAASAAFGRRIMAPGPFLDGITPSLVRAVARRYARFAVVSSVSGLVNAAVVNAPPLLLAGLYGPSVAGFFALGRLVVFAPVGVVANSIARVYYSRVTRARNDAPETLAGLLVTVSLRLMLAVPAFLVLLVIAPPLFATLFGGEWTEVGVYTQLLVPALAFDFVFQTTSVLLPLGFVGRMLAWDLLRLATALGGLVWAHALGADARSAILVYSLGLSACYVVVFLLSVQAVRAHFPPGTRPAAGDDM